MPYAASLPCMMNAIRSPTSTYLQEVLHGDDPWLDHNQPIDVPTPTTRSILRW